MPVLYFSQEQDHYRPYLQAYSMNLPTWLINLFLKMLLLMTTMIPKVQAKNPLNQLQNYCTYHKTVVWVDPKQYIKLLAVNQKMEFWLKLTVRTHCCLIHTFAILMDDSTQTKWGQILRDVEWICHWKRLWICSTTPPRIFY